MQQNASTYCIESAQFLMCPIVCVTDNKITFPFHQIMYEATYDYPANLLPGKGCKNIMNYSGSLIRFMQISLLNVALTWTI